MYKSLKSIIEVKSFLHLIGVYVIKSFRSRSVIGNGSACSVLVSGLPGHCRPRGLADVVSFDIELISVKFKFRVGHGRSRFHVVIIAGELLFEKFARGHFLFWPRSHLSA